MVTRGVQFSQEYQPTPEQRAKAARSRRKDPLSDCLKAYLLDPSKAAQKGGMSAKAGSKWPPRLLTVVQALYTTAVDPKAKGQMAAQKEIWERIAGRVKYEVETTYPQVNEAIEINTAPINPPPMPSAN